MAVMGSMREGKCTGSANRRLRYKLLKLRRISPKRRMGKLAVRGKILAETAWSTVFCRASGGQILENAHGWYWPSRCNSRRVAALTVTASLLAQTLPSSTTGGASRFAAGTKSNSESTADSGSQFPELLAGLVSTSEAAEDDSHAMPSGVVRHPNLDTAVGMGTSLGGKHAPWHGDAVSSLVVAATAIGKRSPERKAAGGHADSTEQSDAASMLGVPAATTPGPEQQAVVPTISPLQMQPTVPSVTAVPNLPVPEDSIAPLGADREPTTQSPLQTSSLALRAGRDLAIAGNTPLDEAGLGLPGAAPGVTVEADGPTIFASLRTAPVTGRQEQQPPAASAMATPGEASGDGEPDRQRVQPWPTPVKAEVGEVESGGQQAEPAIPGAAERGARRAAAAAANDSPAMHAGNLPSDGQAQGQSMTLTAPVPNPPRIDAKADAGSAGGATDAAKVFRSPLESVLSTPAPQSRPRSDGGDVAGPAGETPAEPSVLKL